LPFSGDLDGALAQSLADGRPLFVMFVAAWCPICSEMRREALTDPSLMAHAGAMRWVMIDIDRDLTTARAWGVEAVPSIVFMNAAGEPRWGMPAA
jgi:thiol:disulfide interchange protein